MMINMSTVPGLRFIRYIRELVQPVRAMEGYYIVEGVQSNLSGRRGERIRFQEEKVYVIAGRYIIKEESRCSNGLKI